MVVATKISPVPLAARFTRRIFLFSLKGRVSGGGEENQKTIAQIESDEKEVATIRGKAEFQPFCSK